MEIFYHVHSVEFLKGSIDNLTIGNRIQYYRLLNGFTQEQVAANAKVDICTVIRYENNQVEHSLDICNKIADALDIDPFNIYDEYLKFLASDYNVQIKTMRKELGLTQKDLAKLINVSVTTIKYWEGKKRCPLREQYEKLRLYIN